MKKKNIDLNKFVVIKFIVTMLLLFVIVLGIISYTLNNQDIEGNELVSVEVGEFTNLGVYSEADALSTLTPTSVSVVNNTSRVLDYKLYFIIKDTSTIDKSFVRVNFNGTTYNLADMNYLELNGGKYFFLIDGEIDGESNQPFEAKIWIDSSFNGDYQNAKLFVDFGTLS